jgi:hypothetical protein
MEFTEKFDCKNCNPKKCKNEECMLVLRQKPIDLNKPLKSMYNNDVSKENYWN